MSTQERNPLHYRLHDENFNSQIKLFRVNRLRQKIKFEEN